MTGSKGKPTLQESWIAEKSGFSQIHVKKLHLKSMAEYERTNQQPMRRKRRSYDQGLSATKTGRNDTKGFSLLLTSFGQGLVKHRGLPQGGHIKCHRLQNRKTHTVTKWLNWL